MKGKRLGKVFLVVLINGKMTFLERESFPVYETSFSLIFLFPYSFYTEPAL